MIWEPVSVCGLSSTGFICTVGSTPQANACSHCARPISPSRSSPGIAATAALFDMFCGLNGRTLRPRACRAAEAGDQHALADIGAGALEHDGARHGLAATPPRPAPRRPRDPRPAAHCRCARRRRWTSDQTRCWLPAAPRATAFGSGFSVLAGSDQQNLDAGRFGQQFCKILSRQASRIGGLPAVNAGRQAEDRAAMRHLSKAKSAIAIGIDRRAAGKMRLAHNDPGRQGAIPWTAGCSSAACLVLVPGVRPYPAAA